MLALEMFPGGEARIRITGSPGGLFLLELQVPSELSFAPARLLDKPKVAFPIHAIGLTMGQQRAIQISRVIFQSVAFHQPGFIVAVVTEQARIIPEREYPLARDVFHAADVSIVPHVPPGRARGRADVQNGRQSKFLLA